VIIKEYTKQVMHHVIAHYMLTNAQPDPKQWPLPPGQLLPFYRFRMASHGVEYPFGQFGPAVLAVSPPSFLCTPSLLAGRAV